MTRRFVIKVRGGRGGLSYPIYEAPDESICVGVLTGAELDRLCRDARKALRFGRDVVATQATIGELVELKP